MPPASFSFTSPLPPHAPSPIIYPYPHVCTCMCFATDLLAASPPSPAHAPPVLLLTQCLRAPIAEIVEKVAAAASS